MIGDNETLKQIQAKLKEIARYNKEEYGHILDITDIESTSIVLGKVKYDADDHLRLIKFDIIFGSISFPGESCSTNLHNFYFELSKDFEKDMEKKLKEMTDALDEATFQQKATLRRLDEIIDRQVNG